MGKEVSISFLIARHLQEKKRINDNWQQKEWARAVISCSVQIIG
jgi:hypothetical protein